jgi:transposase
LARNGARVWAELEERCHHCPAGGAVWPEASRATAVPVIGIDQVSRRKGQVYLTVVYDLERRVLLWVGDDRTEEAVRPFFTQEMGQRRCRTLRVVCMDMWAPYAKLVRDYAVHAQIFFDRFHIVKHLSEAVDATRRELSRRLTSQEKVEVKGTRWLLLKNPWNLTNDQKERLSTLVRWNSPLVRAWHLKESFQLFWGYKQPWRAKQHLLKMDKRGHAVAAGAV